MFISKAEKEFFHSTIATLQTRVMNLENAIGSLASEVHLTPSKVVANQNAPWGTKKDGKPRMKPGRPRLVKKAGKK